MGGPQWGQASRGPPVAVLGTGVGGEVPLALPEQLPALPAGWESGEAALFREHVAGTTGGGDSSCSSGARGGGGMGGVEERQVGEGKAGTEEMLKGVAG